MNPKITGEVTLTFVRGGMSKKNTPYLQVSNGRAEFFVTVPKAFDASVFDEYNEDEAIILEVEMTAGSDSVKLLSVIS